MNCSNLLIHPPHTFSIYTEHSPTNKNATVISYITQNCPGIPMPESVPDALDLTLVVMQYEELIEKIKSIAEHARSYGYNQCAIGISELIDELNSNHET